MPKTLILSVGGSISPLICSINHHKPEYIIFFTSTETKEQVTVILQNATHKPKGHDFIITESSEFLNVCLNKLLSQLPEKIRIWNIKPEETIIDYTGGTKSMSAALVLATIELSSNFSYVGGEERNKNGIGVVIDGKEKMLYLKNPWDELAILEKKKINILFNSARYQLARDTALKAAEKVSEKNQAFFKMLALLIEGYMLWDSFKYKDALHKINNAVSKLKIYCAGLDNSHPWHSLLKQIEKNAEFLMNIKKEENIILDILANAKRRAEIENKYDDAVVRIYRTLEKKARLELKFYGIDTSNVDINKVPLSIREEVKSKYLSEDNKRIKIPQYASYLILKEIEKEKGIKKYGYKYFEEEKTLIKEIMNYRNLSIIVHGDNPIDEQKYERAWKNILEFLDIKEENLPIFPQLNI
ncbi:MAG: TIGR02710 family CRISPR-associated CARF protein [Promethearchaeota archaeon]